MYVLTMLTTAHAYLATLGYILLGVHTFYGIATSMWGKSASSQPGESVSMGHSIRLHSASAPQQDCS